MAAKADVRSDHVAKRTFARAFVQSVVCSEIPIFGGAFRAMSKIVFPAGGEKEIALWRARSPDALEDLVDSVIASMACSELALRFGARIARRLDDGLCEPVSFDELSEAFPGVKDAELLKACDELEACALVTLTHGLNDSGQVLADLSLFEAFDPVLHRVNPRVDGAELARCIVSLPAQRVVPTHELVSRFGWPRRRLNPALAVIGTMVAKARASRVIEEDLYVTHLAPNLSERVALRQFADQTLGPVEAEEI
jgi:hypothetical protein